MPDRRFHKVSQVGARKSGCIAREKVEIYAARYGSVKQQDLQDRLTGSAVRGRHELDAIETAWPSN